MIKRLALLTLFATPFLAHAQAPEDEAVAAAKAPSQPLVVMDLTGTFPNNAPTTAMTAPNSAFYLQFTVPETVPYQLTDAPANYGCAVSNVTFVFNGEVFHPAGTYSFAASAGNVETLNFNTRYGAIGLSTYPAYHTPFLTGRYYYYNPTETLVAFISGDQGAGTNWYFVFTPKGKNAPYVVPVSLTDVTGRQVLPPARPLATR